MYTNIFHTANKPDNGLADSHPCLNFAAEYAFPPCLNTNGKTAAALAAALPFPHRGSENPKALQHFALPPLECGYAFH